MSMFFHVMVGGSCDHVAVTIPEARSIAVGLIANGEKDVWILGPGNAEVTIASPRVLAALRMGETKFQVGPCRCKPSTMEEKLEHRLNDVEISRPWWRSILYPQQKVYFCCACGTHHVEKKEQSKSRLITEDLIAAKKSANGGQRMLAMGMRLIFVALLAGIFLIAAYRP